MPLCNLFEQLTPLERSTYIGQLAHACMSDQDMFNLGKKLIEVAEAKGLFEGVTINPTPNDDKTEDNAP